MKEEVFTGSCALCWSEKSAEPQSAGAYWRRPIVGPAPFPMETLASALTSIVCSNSATAPLGTGHLGI